MPENRGILPTPVRGPADPPGPRSCAFSIRGVMSVSLADSQGRPWGSEGCFWPAELPQPQGAARARPGLGPWVAQEMADVCVSDPLKRAAGMGQEHPRGPCGPYACGEPLGLLPVPSTCRSEYTPVPGVTWLPHSSQGLLCGSPIPLSHLLVDSAA